MDSISFAGVYQALKTTKDILTGLFEAKVDAEANLKFGEAQGKLSEVQDVLFVLRGLLPELLQQTRNPHTGKQKSYGRHLLLHGMSRL